MATASTEDIQRIVCEVMAQLGAALARRRRRPMRRRGSPVPRDGEVSVDSRVVTLETIAGRLQGAKRMAGRAAPWSRLRSTTNCGARASRCTPSAAATGKQGSRGCCSPARET